VTGLFFTGSLPIEKSSLQSSHVMMRSPHMNVYLQIKKGMHETTWRCNHRRYMKEVKNERNTRINGKP
jgi:hypothetical protein